MNKGFFIGNLTRDPELRTTTSGVNVCTFTIAVNKKVKQGQNAEADFFRVTAWRSLADICNKYLKKGRKVSVVGAVTLSEWQGRDGTQHAGIEILADDVEFLTPKNENGSANVDQQSGFQTVDMPQEDLPF